MGWTFWVCHPVFWLKCVPSLLGIRAPAFKKGQVVKNRWGTAGVGEEVLEMYLGPYIAYETDWPKPHWIMDELWLTQAGNQVACGYFWSVK